MATKYWVGGTSGDYSVAGNWSPSGVPAAGDDVIIQGTVAITAGLDQSAVELNSFTVLPGYSGAIGSLTGFLIIDLGDGDRFEFAGTGLSFISVGSAAVSPVITNTATVSSGSGLYLLGTALATVTLLKGSLEVFTGSTVTTINQGYTSTLASDTALSVPTGVTLTTLNRTGGTCTLNVGATTVTNDGGTLTTRGAGTITTMNVTGGTVYPNSTGTITTLNADGGTVDFTRSRGARTVTTLNRTGDSVVILDDAYVTLTNAVTTDGPYQIAGV